MKKIKNTSKRTEVKASPVMTFTEKDFKKYLQNPQKPQPKHTIRYCYLNSKTRNENNSSRNDNKPENEKPEAADKATSNSEKETSVFANPEKNLSQLAAEVIRADCLKHGYLVGNTIGEGAYAKVKLAEVIPSKMARMPDMTDFADYEGSLKVQHIANY